MRKRHQKCVRLVTALGCAVTRAEHLRRDTEGQSCFSLCKRYPKDQGGTTLDTLEKGIAVRGV